jgi:hypothetical protein
VLLNIFQLYKLADPDEYYDGEHRPVVVWHRQRWWYKLTHVCRQWRNVILESPTQLDLHLYCTNGVPVADMLAHSPPLPLTICYRTDLEITAEDESGILLALSHRDRVRHIYFSRLPNVGKFVTVMDDQFPSLERLYVTGKTPTEVGLPVMFQAPNLRHLRLMPACIPLRSPLLTTAAGLVTLSLRHIPASAYFPPSYILARLSLLLQLETLSITFQSPIPNRDIERQPRQTTDMTTLPNLRWFSFRGMTTYLEALAARISAPSLNKLHVYLFNQLSFTFPRLLQFMQTSENLGFTSVQVTFSALAVSLHAVPWSWDSPLMLEISCRHLDWQVASTAQSFGTLSPLLSVVEQVTFSYERHERSSEWHNDVDQRQWRELLMPFANAKTIHVQDELVHNILRSLLSDDGEPPPELLPNLVEVGYDSVGLYARDALNAFVDARRVAGHPVSLRKIAHSNFLDGMDCIR